MRSTIEAHIRKEEIVKRVLPVEILNGDRLGGKFSLTSRPPTSGMV